MVPAKLHGSDLYYIYIASNLELFFKTNLWFVLTNILNVYFIGRGIIFPDRFIVQTWNSCRSAAEILIVQESRLQYGYIPYYEQL